MEKKILFVDDNLFTREMILEMLTEFGFQLTLADCGKAALNILETTFFPLIILDLMMPEMDGIELCKHIRKNNTQSVIYAYSAAADKYNQDEMEKIGFNGVIFKPSKNGLLIKAVKGAFEQYQQKTTT